MALDGFIKNIAFFGSAEVGKNNKYYKQAYNIAQILAKNDYRIINGGGPGIMDASTQGAEFVGGNTLAVTFSPKDAPGFEGRYLKNRVDKEIKTNNYIERMFGLLENADCFIIFKGGTGTLSEFTTSWLLAHIYYPNYKPVILFGKFWQNIINNLKKNMMIREESLKVFKIIEREDEVIPTIKKFEEDIK